MRIGQLANETGVTTKTIRFYEGAGVLPEPGRDDNGYRNYDGDFVDRLRFVKDAQSAGLTLKEIGTILDLRDAGKTTCRHTTSLLEGHLAGLDTQIAEMQRMRADLVDLVTRARQVDPTDCTDPNRCQTIAPA